MTRVWVNGCYDLLHAGHLALLKYAHSLGDCLVCGIDSDKRVKRNKGYDRPIWNQEQRKKNLIDTGLVWEVKIFETDGQLKRLIKEYKPDIFVIGSDYKGKKIIGGSFAKQIIYFERIGGISTTNILKENQKYGHSEY